MRFFILLSPVLHKSFFQLIKKTRTVLFRHNASDTLTNDVKEQKLFTLILYHKRGYV